MYSNSNHCYKLFVQKLTIFPGTPAHFIQSGHRTPKRGVCLFAVKEMRIQLFAVMSHGPHHSGGFAHSKTRQEVILNDYQANSSFKEWL